MDCERDGEDCITGVDAREIGGEIAGEVASSMSSAGWGVASKSSDDGQKSEEVVTSSHGERSSSDGGRVTMVSTSGESV